MISIKTQVEVKYTFLLNFTSFSREILSPYLRLAQLSINNIDTSQESIILNFSEEHYSLDCRWDRLIFVCDHEPDNFKSSNGPLNHFFEILTKFQKQSSFGKVLNILLAKWFIVEDEKAKDFDTVLKKFKSNYFTSNVPDLKGTLDDLGIVMETREGKINDHTEFGPFKPEKDIRAHNLYPNSLGDRKSLEKLQGILVKNIVSDTMRKPDFKVFLELYEYQANKVVNAFKKLEKGK